MNEIDTMLSELIKKQAFLNNSQRFVSHHYKQLYSYACNHDFELNSDENLSEVQNRKAPNLFLKIYKLLYLRNKRLANRRKITFIQSQINFNRTGFQYAYTSKTYS